MSTDNPTPVPERCDFKPTDHKEVGEIIHKSQKQIMHTWLLKEKLGVFLPAFTSIVNTSLSTGTFPAAMKNTVVTPLLKKPNLDKNSLKNYGPMSNTAFL